jgi:hypothetical protein
MESRQRMHGKPGAEPQVLTVQEVAATLKVSPKTDWNVKEQVRAKLRSTIKRLLLRYGYPPDQEPAATALVLEQAEVIAGGETALPRVIDLTTYSEIHAQPTARGDNRNYM